MKKGISIIIPNYNAGSFLNELVESIFQQPITNQFEVIIVDDKSSDEDTKLVLDKLEKSYDIKVIRLDSNQGAQHARNVALEAASFDYIFPIDSDDKLNLDKSVVGDGTYMDKAVEILSTSPNVAFVHGIYQMFGETEKTELLLASYRVTEQLVLEKHHVQTGIVYRKKDALEAGLYDENIKKWQDWSFGVGILNARFLAGKKNEIAFLNRPYYLYRTHTQVDRISGTNISEIEMITKTIQKHPEIFRNYYKEVSDEDLPSVVLSKKPSFLKDLLYIAANDLQKAIDIIERRGYKI